MWFECKTSHGTWLTIDQHHRLNHAAEKSADQVWLFWPAGGKALAFLIGRHPGRRFAVPPSLYQAPAIAVLLKCVTGHYTLTLAEETALISAELLDDGNAVIANRRFANAWEYFDLLPIADGEISDAHHHQAKSIEVSRQAATDPIGLVRSLRQDYDWWALEAILPSLSQRVRTDLSQLLLRDPSMTARMRAAFPQDPWAQIGIPALGDWLFDKSASQAIHQSMIGPDLDWLGHRYLPERRRGLRPMSATELILRQTRAETVPTKGACILATARNEGVYYLEWIAYHRAIGFEHFFIYTNDNDDYSDDLLSVLAAAGIIDLVHSSLGPHQNAQAKAYAHALGLNPKILDYVWTMVCDLDEFLLIDADYFANLQEFLAFHERAPVDCINISWSHVSASGQIRWDDRPLIDRCATGHFWLDSKVKSIFRPARAVQSYAHFPVEPAGERLIYRNAAGDLRVTHKAEDEHGIHGRHLDDDPEYRFATILHYYWKSAEEFLWKHSRNKGDHARVEGRNIGLIHPAEISYFLKYAGTQPTPDTPSAPRKFAKNFDAELAHLRSLPGVSAAEWKIKQNFRNVIDRLKLEFLEPKNLDRLGPPGREFAQLLQSSLVSDK
jgi:hypothetical protein